MASVKMTEKRLLEKLQAKITIKIGKKITQQEILDKSIQFVYKRIDSFISEEIEPCELTEEIIKKIEENTIDAPLSYPHKTDDELIYDL